MGLVVSLSVWIVCCMSYTISDFLIYVICVIVLYSYSFLTLISLLAIICSQVRSSFNDLSFHGSSPLCFLLFMIAHTAYTSHDITIGSTFCR